VGCLFFVVGSLLGGCSNGSAYNTHPRKGSVMTSSKYMKGYTSKRRIKFFAIAAVVALSALSFGGSPAHATGTATLTPSPVPQVFSHVTMKVAGVPSEPGLYKFCDGGNLVYEMYLYDDSSSVEATSIQVQFDSSQCQVVSPLNKIGGSKGVAAKVATAPKKPKK